MNDDAWWMCVSYRFLTPCQHWTHYDFKNSQITSIDEIKMGLCFAGQGMKVASGWNRSQNAFFVGKIMKKTNFSQQICNFSNVLHILPFSIFLLQFFWFSWQKLSTQISRNSGVDNKIKRSCRVNYSTFFSRFHIVFISLLMIH